MSLYLNEQRKNKKCDFKCKRSDTRATQQSMVQQEKYVKEYIP